MNRSSDENEQTHVSDSRRIRTEDPMSGTKAWPPWIRTHNLKGSGSVA